MLTKNIFEGYFSGTCKGDSGGPLTVTDSDNTKTLIGVVSGGVGCGQGVPGFYTKVSFHSKWIKCIIEKSVQFNNNKEKVEEACMYTVKPQPTCVKPNELVVNLDVFQKTINKNEAYEICETLDDGFDFDLRDKTGKLLFD